MTERVNRPARETGIAWPRRRVVWSAFLVVAVGGLGTLRLVWPQSAHTVEPCRVNGVSETVRCYSVEVPESTRDPSGRKIRIRVVVLPARGPERPREPLLLIQGGPGVPGTLMARNFAQREVLRVGRELVFFDQRGTGGSQSLSCAFLRRHNFLGALFPPDHVTECRRELRRQADLAAYTNTASAEDLEAIRKAIGAEVWSLAGFSFGTRLAQMYARRHPERVRAVVLDGVVPFDADLTADLAESMERSIDFVISRCALDRACRARYPDTQRSIVRIARLLDSLPANVHVIDSAGRTLSGPFTRWDFAYAVRGMLYGPLAASLPAWVHEAERTKDFSAFARVYWQRSRWVGDSTSLALHLGVYCSEDLPFSDSARAVERASGTLIGARYYLEYRAGCAAWPMPRAPDEMRQAWKSDIPTLLFSGERDPVTPPEYGARVARHLTRGRHFVITGGGHAEQSSCKTQVIASFLADPAQQGRVRNCLDLLVFPSFAMGR
jgi:pimeloyl-ACP methyl ester carboxylesterase